MATEFQIIQSTCQNVWVLYCPHRAPKIDHSRTQSVSRLQATAARARVSLLPFDKWSTRDYPLEDTNVCQARLGQPGSIPAFVLPSGGMAARHRKGATAERLLLTSADDLFTAVMTEDSMVQTEAPLFLSGVDVAILGENLEYQQSALVRASYYAGLIGLVITSGGKLFSTQTIAQGVVLLRGGGKIERVIVLQYLGSVILPSGLAKEEVDLRIVTPC
ncbi:hypothetical protein CLF_110653 [Clonorchis sinensis]|uniref:Uncharacterized protein n=1 Tax=Clonorchis sinensis TaxID=79923 RepID=G7YL01_CLOSI|nr:hypothetical protein CLF_110653 [Clonorchis sinensis]